MANLQVILNELKQERDRLDKAIAAINPLTGNAGTRARTGRRTMSTAARAKIAAAQRARWAKTKGSQAKPKRKISAAGLARIRAAQKARWAKVRAGKK